MRQPTLGWGLLELLADIESWSLDTVNEKVAEHKDEWSHEEQGYNLRERQPV